MFSKELENLIEATLADGILEDHEKAALVKRAQREGVDLDELEIYIQSILQKRVQNQKVQIDKETAAHEKLRKGNRCPHCDTEIPPLTKICPNCGRPVNSNETSGDKELFDFIDVITHAIVDVKSATTLDQFRKKKAECEALLKKADIFYGDNKKIQMLVFDLKNEISKAESNIKKTAFRTSLVNTLRENWRASIMITLLIVMVVLILLGGLVFTEKSIRSTLDGLASYVCCAFVGFGVYIIYDRSHSLKK